MLHCPTCGRSYADEVRVCADDGTPLQADSTVAIDAPRDPLIGRTLDEKYRLDARLGEGGMGTVYRATHLLIDRPVAIKVLKPRFVEDEAAQTRFRREARAAGRLQHSNAVAVTDFGRTSDGFVYIVMELLEGRSLRDVLIREAPLDPARAVSMMMQTSAAVAAAHEAGVIHRDLKPANIFIVQRRDAPPFVKVLDFGIAKLAAETLDDEDPQTLTQVGALIGTPRYMSPEQCNGEKLTPASDVYSLGIILYEMVTGMTPFNGTSPLAIAMKHSQEEPRPPRELVPSIPQPLEDIIMHALEKNATDRPSNAGEFRRELYMLAQRLGFEHSGIEAAPTIETLRSAGTETPSGRLVIDIEKWREQRASSMANQQAVANGTTGERLIEPAPQTATIDRVVPLKVKPTAPAPSSAVLRLQIFFEQKKPWLRKHMLLLLVGLLLLLVVGGVYAARSSSTGKLVSVVKADESFVTEIIVTSQTALARINAPPKSETPAEDSPHESERQSGERERNAAHRENKRGKGDGFFGGMKNGMKKVGKKILHPF